MAAIVLTLTLTGPVAYAHTDAELDTWRMSWAIRALVGGDWPAMEAEYVDMSRRHPRYFGLPVPHYHTPTPQVQAYTAAGVEQWRTLVAAYFRPGDVDRALRIMRCESGGNPNAKNPGSSASGLFQHLGKYWATRSAAAGYAGVSIFDPTANVATAAWLRDQAGGWSHWVCR